MLLSRKGKKHSEKKCMKFNEFYFLAKKSLTFSL